MYDFPGYKWKKLQWEKPSALTPSSGAGTVGDKEAKESSYCQTFQDLSTRHALHKPSFGQVVKEKSDNGSNNDGFD